MDFYELEQLYKSGADKEKIFAAMEELGLNATEENNRASTFLHIAAKYADAVTLKKLLDAGLDANAKNKARTHCSALPIRLSATVFFLRRIKKPAPACFLRLGQASWPAARGMGRRFSQAREYMGNGN